MKPFSLSVSQDAVPGTMNDWCAKTHDVTIMPRFRRGLLSRHGILPFYMNDGPGINSSGHWENTHFSCFKFWKNRNSSRALTPQIFPENTIFFPERNPTMCWVCLFLCFLASGEIETSMKYLRVQSSPVTFIGWLPLPLFKQPLWAEICWYGFWIYPPKQKQSPLVHVWQ